MEGWMDGQSGGWMDGWMEAWTDGLSFASHSKNYDPLNAGQHGRDTNEDNDKDTNTLHVFFQLG